MQHEIETFVVAGTETTAHALACTTFHVLNDVAVLRALKAELATAGDEAALQTLEQLPFLTAVILEGLRLSYGVATRLPRISPDQAIRYGRYTIPPGVSRPRYFSDCRVIPIDNRKPDSSLHVLDAAPSQPVGVPGPAHLPPAALDGARATPAAGEVSRQFLKGHEAVRWY